MAIRALNNETVNQWIDLHTVLSIDNTYNVSLFNKSGGLLRVTSGATAPVDNNDGIWLKSGDKVDFPAHTDPVEKIWVTFIGSIAVSYWK